MAWAILYAEKGRAGHLAASLAANGAQVWQPSLFCWRAASGRRKARKWHVEILPGIVLLRVDHEKKLIWLPPGLTVDIDHFQTDASDQLITIPDIQIERFVAAVDAENEARMARAAKSRAPGPKKREWRRLEPGTMAEVLAKLYGTVDAP